MKKVYTSFVMSRESSNRNIPIEEIRNGSYTKQVSKEQLERIKKAGASALQQMRNQGILTNHKG